jgi:lysophospholipase L1-like esterase
MADINLNKIIKVILLLISITASFFFTWSFYFNGYSILFYLSFIIFCICLVGLVYYLFKPGLLLYVSIIALIFSVLLPGIDFLYSNIKDYINKPDKIIYSYREAKGNPAAFKKWWNHVVYEWGNGPQKSIEKHDPYGILPFVYIPNSKAKFFDSNLRINNLGLRGKDISLNKGKCYRIVALGESTTFGATIKPSDRPWPEVLQELVNDLSLKTGKCIEIINAGTVAYDLKDNLERVRRDIIPLNPDLIISYHGLNGLRHLQAELLPRVKKKTPPRASRILEDVEFKIAALRKAPKKLVLKGIGQPRPLPELLQSEYAELYRRLLEMGRRHNFAVALVPYNMAVTRESPADVIDFYAGGFPEVRQYISAIEDHNVLVEALARHKGAFFWDVRSGINGAYDDDVYIDLVHFTQKGRNMMAKAIFQHLKPFLISTLGRESASRTSVFDTDRKANAMRQMPSE